MPFKKAKKLVKKARKTVKKLIPKEVRAIAPYVAAYYAGPAMAGSGFMSGISNAALRNAISKGLVAGATQFATDDEADFKDVARAGILAAAPDAIAGGSEALATKLDPRSLSYVNPNMEVGKLAADTAKGLRSIQKGVEGAGALKTIGAQSAIEGASRLKEIEQDELDRYNRELQDRGIRDKAQRRTAIRNIYLGVGYDEDYIDGMLDRFGYKKGGKAKKAAMTLEEFIEEYYKPREMELAGGGIANIKRGMVNESGSYSGDVAAAMAFRDLMKTGKYTPEEASKIAKEIAEDEEEEISKYANLAEEGFKSAFGVESLFPQAPRPMGITPGFGNLPRMAEGGLMNLGGNEMDLRGGGFVPIGKKEKADDVPARLSKNEFVMTADAVRGAGGGDVNEGARRMYQTMDKLEAMA